MVRLSDFAVIMDHIRECFRAPLHVVCELQSAWQEGTKIGEL